MADKPQLIVFASGSGTTFEYLACHPKLNVVLMAADRKQCQAVQRAQKLDIPVKIISPKTYSSYSQWDKALTKEIQNFSAEKKLFQYRQAQKNLLSEKKTNSFSLKNFFLKKAVFSKKSAGSKEIKANTHWIILAGFLRRLGPCFISAFKNQIINSHPSLLPQFGGKGMYGIHVHRAVCRAQKKTTGLTIHYVNEEYDEGSIIAQKKIKVNDGETPESLQERVKKKEKIFYAKTIIKLSRSSSFLL